MVHNLKEFESSVNQFDEMKFIDTDEKEKNACDEALYHITPQANKQSILKNGLIRGNHAFICLCENPNNWDGLVNNSIIFKIDIKAYIKAYPHIKITTWLPQSDEICVWGDIPKKYIKYINKSEI